MLLAENDPPKSHSGAAAEPEAAAPANATTPIPEYDPFSDEELWRRVGEVIAKAARRPSPPRP
jgi:hypothetical protein